MSRQQMGSRLYVLSGLLTEMEHDGLEDTNLYRNLQAEYEMLCSLINEKVL